VTAPDRDHADGPTTVVHLITTLGQGGAERVLSQVVPRPHDVPRRPDGRPAERHVVVSLVDGGMFADVLLDAGVEVRGLGMRPGRDVVRGTLRLAALLRELRPHMVVSWMYHASLLDLLARPLAGRGRRARMVWYLQASLDSLGTLQHHTRATIRLLAWTSGRPEAIAINSRAGRTQHAAFGYRPKRWVHLPNGCDTDRFAPDADDRAVVRRELGVAGDRPLFVFVGRAHAEKGIDLLLDALERLPDVEPITVALIGSGTAELAVTHRPDLRLLTLGMRQDVARLLRGADALVLPSRSEGTSNAVIEAMAAAIPCLVTDVGDSAELVGDSGIVVAPGSADELTRGITEMLALGPDGRRRRGALARARVLETQSLDVARSSYRALWADAA
jgi:glycosyltransferase involved in cell wall biosynthesis